MKTSIISQSLAVLFIGTVFLACGSPIASNPNTLIQRINAELSDSNGLTRRDRPSSPIPDIITTGEPTRNPLGPGSIYITPLVFMDFLQDCYCFGRERRIEVWHERRVNDLEATVDSLEASEFPTWLIDECWERINFEARLIHLFLSEEAKESDFYTMIEDHAKDIDRVKRKLWEHAPRPGVTPPTPYVEIESTVSRKEPNRQINGVHGRPSRSRSSSPAKKSQDILPQHTKARRERIEQWARDEVQPLMQQLQTLTDSSFPIWLVDDCTYQISHALALIALFEQEEISYRGTWEEHDGQKYLNMMETHKAALSGVEKSLQNKRNEFLDGHLQHLLPRMRVLGDWRLVVKNFVKEVKQRHAYDRRADDQLAAAFQAYKAMATLELKDQNLELLAFHDFLRDQKNKITQAKRKFYAGQHGHGTKSH
ncbi:hypothetical protein H0H93_005023 [Arthromyces matolae]|nr:hypothetical protein H0H93_005023 [Arthromyces matolae]